jgi:hypothetical protein
MAHRLFNFAPLFSVAAILASAPGAAASPTPALSTGEHPGYWSLVVLRDPTQYSQPFVNALHPTSVHYDATSHSYVLSDGSVNYTFSAGEIVSSKTNPTYTFYRDTSSGSTLQLLNDSSTNPLIALTYVTYGKWIIPASSPIKLDHNYVVFGSNTPAASVPRTGSASYHAIIDGTYVNSKGTYTLSGNASFVASFGAGTMGLTVTPVGTNTSNGSTLSFGTLTGGGFIDFSNASFNATSRVRNADGSKTLFSADGYFFGPKATEIGGAFTLTQTLGTTTLGAGAGAFVGKH